MQVKYLVTFIVLVMSWLTSLGQTKLGRGGGLSVGRLVLNGFVKNI